MAQGELHLTSVDLGAYIGATHRPFLYVSPNYGQIKILDAKVTGMAAGTSIGLGIYSATNVGTPVINGTVGVFAGTVVYAEGVVFACTISDSTVDPGTTGVWLAVDQTSGTAPANTILTISYLMGV